MNRGPKLHHYVPQFELSYYSNKGMLWVYDRKTRKIRKQSIKNTAAISNYYSFTAPSGEVDKGLEEALSITEGIAAPIIKKIDKGDWKLTPEERWELAAYLGLKWTRTPEHQRKTEALFEAVLKVESRRLASDEKKFNEAVDKISKETGESTDDKKGLREFMLDTNRYKIGTTRLTSLQSMVRGLKDIYPVIYKMRWIFRYAPKGKAFITSDNPFFVKPFFQTDNPLGYGLLAPHTVTFIPLTPRVCLTLINDKPGTNAGKTDGDMVNELNNDVALFSSRFVISHNERLLKKVIERSRLSEVKPYKSIVEIQVEPDEIIRVVKE